MSRVVLERPADLDPAAVLAVAGGAGVELARPLLDRLAASRSVTLEALAAGGPVYGVTTGLGSQAHLAVGVDEPAFQDDLMLGRSVGGAPWLTRREVRAVLATRLRTLLEPEVGASTDLAAALVAVLHADLAPAVPATGNGAAGEIIPLAHLGAFLTGRGEGLAADPGPGPAPGRSGQVGPLVATGDDDTPTPDVGIGQLPARGSRALDGGGYGEVRPAADLLGEAGLAPYSFGAKEGVAFLQGVPVAAALAVLLADGARGLASQATVVLAAAVALVRAPRDPWTAGLVRSDEVLGDVLAVLRELAGPEATPRMLQAPVSFRVAAPAVAHLLRAVAALEDAVERALTAVSTSPALVGGRFLGTAGFDGFELAASADAVHVAVLHLAELGTARLHRLLDPRVSGLASQLSAVPGRQAGLVALHKRAVGQVHEARRHSVPASLGAMETSQGQEDVQSFALEAVRAAGSALLVLRAVTACELVAVHQATLLEPSAALGSERLKMVLHQAFEALDPLARGPRDAGDRPVGPEVTALTALLDVGWGADLLVEHTGVRVRTP